MIQFSHQRRGGSRFQIPWIAWMLTFSVSVFASDLVQPAGEPFRVELLPEPREQKVSDIAMHIDGVTLEYLYRGLNVADYGREAQNVNEFDEVPDSEWFINRIERQALTASQAARGPNRGNGPDATGPWEIQSSKMEGGTPGLLIKDARGERYFLKFDPVDHPELWTAAEIIGTRIVWAAGFNTPENHLVLFRDEILKIGPKAHARGAHGEIPMTQVELAAMLQQVGRAPDGSIRAVASRFLPGKPKGPFLFTGTRSEDPNDTVDHRHRRELRGLTVIYALINNTDWKELNTLDVFVPQGKQGYLKHYLLDFNQSLGAGNRGEKEIWGGHEYFVDLKGIGWSHLTQGLPDRAWERARPSPWRSVGTFESKVFDGRHWHPWRAVPPFLYFTARDGFWAAKIVASFTDEHLAAIVKEARYSDPAAEAFVLNALKERRDKIAKIWFGEFTPVRRFRVQENELSFEDLLVRGGYFPSSHACYRFRSPGGGWTEITERRVPLPQAPSLVLELQSRYSKTEEWQRPVRITVKRANGELHVSQVTR